MSDVFTVYTAAALTMFCVGFAAGVIHRTLVQVMEKASS